MEIITNHLKENLDSYILKNNNGMRVTILNYGAAIARIEAPDKNGKIENVTLGHNDLVNFIGGPYYLGATVGRYANRIAGGRFTIDGKEYQVSLNKPGFMLHGGFTGFDKKYWKARIIDSTEESALELSLISPDGDEGFPGAMEIKAIYKLSYKNELLVKYIAASDKTTVINITNHSYFNLTGNPDNTILDHIVKIYADNFTPTNNISIPTGNIASVENTPLDFRQPCRVGDRIDDNFDQLVFAKGYDQNFVINNFNGEVRETAAVYEPTSGRFMEVLTDQPGMQFYSGNYLNGIPQGTEGIYPKRRTALCFECQHFPNSPNEEDFPSVILKPGKVYNQTTIYRFSTK